MRRLFLSLVAVIVLPGLLSQAAYADYELDVQIGEESWQYNPVYSTDDDVLIDMDADGGADFEMYAEGASFVLNALGEWVFYNQMWTSKNEPYTLCSYDIDGPQMWVRRMQRATVDSGSEFVFLVWNLGTKQYYYATINGVVNAADDWYGVLNVDGPRQPTEPRSCEGVAVYPEKKGLRACISERSDLTDAAWTPKNSQLLSIKIKQYDQEDAFMEPESLSDGGEIGCFTHPETPEQYHLVATDLAQIGYDTPEDLLIQQVKMCVEEDGVITNFLTDQNIAAGLVVGQEFEDGGFGSFMETPRLDAGCYFGNTNSPEFPIYRFNFWRAAPVSDWTISPSEGVDDLPDYLIDQWLDDMRTARIEARLAERRAERRAARVEARRAERKAQRQADREAQRQENTE